MNIVRSFRNIVSDLYNFGPRFIVHYFHRIPSNHRFTVNVPSFGRFYVRSSNSDILTLRQVFGNKEYEIRNNNIAKRVRDRYVEITAAGKTPIIVDAGANIGAASVWFSQLYPKAAIVAIEPDPDNAALLKRNVADRPSCTVLEAAVGANPGFVELKGDRFGWAVQTERAATGIQVVTIDQACAASRGDTLFIVKIDIEGFERDLFAMNHDWLKSAFVVIVEPHDWMLPGTYSSHHLQKAMALHRFEMLLKGENIFYIR